jgi:hypothetical protein
MTDSSDARPPEFAASVAEMEALYQKIFPNHPSQEQVDRFFKTLGRAISLWQLVETALYEVYERALGPLRPGACGASFHSIQSFSGKLSATDAAVSFALIEDGATLEQWKQLRRKADEKARRRNEFAHFSTYIMFNKEHENEKIRLEPPMYDWRFVNSRHPTLGADEIEEITNRFVDLANELKRFTARIPSATR